MDDKATVAKKKIEFNMRITLVPSDSWVQCGSFLDLCYNSRAIIGDLLVNYFSDRLC